MRFSIIIPAYNAYQTIGYCLDSVVNQDYPINEFEVIVVDDCSTDSQNNTIARYTIDYAIGGGNQPTVRLISHKTNKRQGGARNTAIKAAQGEWVLFLDADDYWLSNNVLKNIARRIDENANADIIESISHTDLPEWQGMTECPIKSIGIYENGKGFLLTGQYSGYVWRSAYRKSLIEKIPFRENVYFEDGDWRVKTALAAKTIVVIDYPFYGYVNNPLSTCRSKNIEVFHANIASNLLLLRLYESQTNQLVRDHGMRQVKSNILSWLKISRNYDISQSAAALRSATNTDLFNPTHYTLSIMERLLFDSMKYFPLLTVTAIKAAVLLRRKLRKILR